MAAENFSSPGDEYFLPYKSVGMDEPQEEEEGSGWGLQEPRGLRSPSPLVEILEDQQFVEEEQDYVPICRVRCSPGQAVRLLPPPVQVL